MHLPPVRRATRRRFLRLLKAFITILVVYSFLETLFIHRNVNSRDPVSAVDPGPKNQKIFVASTHWNNERILRSHWNDALLDLVRTLGATNVYVSIVEGGSWDDSKGALRELDARLGELKVARTIVLDERTHKDEIEAASIKGEGKGLIKMPRGKVEIRRIPFLSKQRNLALQPLERLEGNETKFNKMLFLNDVVFKTEDVLRLLGTNNGDYAAACAMDFAKPPAYYDTFALRDAAGDEAIMQTWPYFRAAASRNEILANRPAPVASCWNGLVFMDAEPFYDKISPLRFRGISDSLALSHLEGSECCLIHADNLLSPNKGVWINPAVRVGYSGPAYDAVHEPNGWLGTLDVTRGIWVNRFLRWTTTTWFTKRTVVLRVRSWIAGGYSLSEPGVHCLINEMQVLVHNGWAHV